MQSISPIVALRAKAVDHRDIVGHATLPQLLEHRELQRLVAEAAAEGRRPGLVQPMERALQPLVRAAVGIEPSVLRIRSGCRRRAATRRRGPPARDAACRLRSPRGRAAARRRPRAHRSPAADPARADPTGRRRRSTRAVAQNARSPCTRLRWLMACGRSCREATHARTGCPTQAGPHWRPEPKLFCPELAAQRTSRRASDGIRRRGGHGRAGAQDLTVEPARVHGAQRIPLHVPSSPAPS